MPFQTPVTELAIRNRRDTLQHTFFEPIHLWAEGVRLFSFGTPFGRNTLAVLVPGAPDFDDKDVDQVLALYRKGAKEFPEVFRNAVIHDMNRIGYDLTDIGAQTPTAVSVEGVLPGQLLALYVQEKDLDCKTEQIEMSQGMFRALAICIHLNYAAFSKAARTCILIDDIGEGLDFDRSCALIKVIMEKATASGAQLVMSTNDRYVMNNVPLEHWAVIIRNGATCSIVTPRTNPKAFEEFRFTGLSNFDFFSMNFAKGE